MTTPLRLFTDPHHAFPTDKVYRALVNGSTSGRAIKNATGLLHEDIYRALAWLEARGLAILTCSKKHDGRVYIEWGTQ